MHNAWVSKQTRGNKWEKVRGKLNYCKNTIQMWVRKKVQDSGRLINSKTKELEAIQEENTEDMGAKERLLKGLRRSGYGMGIAIQSISMLVPCRKKGETQLIKSKTKMGAYVLRQIL